MSKWLIVSDTHGETESLERLLQEKGHWDGLIHLGDHAWDTEQIAFSGDIVKVRGNTDRGDTTPLRHVLIMGGKRILVTHGHEEHVKFGLDRLYYAALEQEAEIVLFGHTHTAVDQVVDGIRFFNPGSLSRPRGRRSKTYGVLEISGTEAILKIIDFE